MVDPKLIEKIYFRIDSTALDFVEAVEEQNRGNVRQTARYKRLLSKLIGRVIEERDALSS